MEVMRHLKSITSRRSSISDQGGDASTKRAKFELEGEADTFELSHGDVGTQEADQLPKEMHEMKIRDDKFDHGRKEITTAVINENGTEIGHMISTTIGGQNGQPKQIISYMADHVVGTGSFGIVFEAKCLETAEIIAIKKVLQDKRYKNRELEIMRMLEHPNIFRALAYIHGIGVSHRDIKPQNLLVNPHTHQLKLCDFGSAKMLVKGEPNIAYICSRYYRAPELIFGATEYNSEIDIWSMGCVLAELLFGQPLFPGETNIDQLVEIIKVLGTPTREEIKCMNPNCIDFKFPRIKTHPWHKVFRKQFPLEAVDLVSRLLQYYPNKRCIALEAFVHPFFDELRDPHARLPNGSRLPPLFNFSPQELIGASPELIARLLPQHIGKPNLVLSL